MVSHCVRTTFSSWNLNHELNESSKYHELNESPKYHDKTPKFHELKVASHCVRTTFMLLDLMHVCVCVCACMYTHIYNTYIHVCVCVRVCVRVYIQQLISGWWQRYIGSLSLVALLQKYTCTLRSPLIMGLFSGKWLIKIRHPLHLRHSVRLCAHYTFVVGPYQCVRACVYVRIYIHMCVCVCTCVCTRVYVGKLRTGWRRCIDCLKVQVSFRK